MYSTYLRTILVIVFIVPLFAIVVAAGTPNWTISPYNISILNNQTLGVQFEANDTDGIDTYFLNNTANFSINGSGYFSNATVLQVRTYWVNISVNDSLGNVLSQLIFIEVNDSMLVDSDGDGFNVTYDCDDNNASVNPNATEIDNDADDDCDDWADEGIPSEVWLGTTASNYGYIEYVPENYSNTSANGYNLLIWWAGIGRNGNGTTQLDKLYAYGTPKLFDDNDWPPRNITNQTTRTRLNYSTIVMMPQNPSGIWNAASMKTFVEYVISAYNVNTSYIYATGNSAGGIGIWRYLGVHENETDFAAVVPIFGDGDDYKTEACRFKHVAIWSHHGEQDVTITVDKSINPYDGLNNCTNAPLDNRLTLYPTHGHDDPLIDNIINGSYVNNYATNTSYDNFTEDIYSWMFRYTFGDMNATADADLDFYDSDVDCDETNASINPGASDVLDGVDNDCDNIPDNGFGPNWTIEPTNVSLLDNETFNATYNASDLQGIDTYYLSDSVNFSINGSGFIQNITTLQVGTYSLTVFVNDTYGFLLNASISIEVNSSIVPDTTPPVWNISPYNISRLDNQSINVTFNATDNVGIYAYAVDNASFNISSTGIFMNVSTLVVGNHTVNVSVNDTSNNTLSAIIVIEVNTSNPLDTTPPSWTVAPTNITRNLSVGVGEQYNATDNVGIFNYSVNDTTRFSMNESGYLSNITTLVIGNYSIEIIVNDTSNNTLSANITIEIVNISYDANPPVWDITPYNFSVLDNQSINVTFNATDDTGIFNYSVNDSARFSINATGFFTNRTTLVIGNYTLNITVNDTSNNTLSAIILIQVNTSVIPDTTRPSINFSNETQANESYLSSTYFTVNITASDETDLANIYLYLFNNSVLVNVTNTSLSNLFVNFTNLSDGNYSFIAYANDSSNNTANTSLRWVIIDTTPPNITITSPVNESTITSDSLVLFVTSNEDVTVLSSLNGDVNVTCFTLSTSNSCAVGGLSDGYFNLTVFAVDAAGNAANTTTLFVSVAIPAPSSSNTGGSSSSSSSGGSVGNSGPQEVDVSSEEQTLDGSSLTTYELDTGKNTSSKLKIKSVSEEEVVLDLEFLKEPISIGINETIFYDADGDGENDTLVSIEDIVDGVASLKITPYELPKHVIEDKLSSEPTTPIIVEEEVIVSPQEKDQLVTLLEEKGFEANANNIVPKKENSVKTSKSRKTTKVVRDDGVEEVVTQVIIDVSQATKNGELYLIEVIPKEFAATVAELEFSQPPIVLEDDPVVMWHLDEIEDEVITYKVNKNVSITGNTVFFSQEEDVQPSTEIPQDESSQSWKVWVVVILSGFIISGTVIALSKNHKSVEEETSDSHKPDLLEYVATLRKENLSTDQIRKKLLEFGWPQDIVNKVVSLKDDELEEDDSYPWQEGEKEQLIIYIKKQLDKGKSKEEIEKILEGVGWKEEARNIVWKEVRE